MPFLRGLALAIALAGLAIAIPGLMGDGVDDRPADRRLAANDGLRCAYGLIDNVFERGYTRRLRVASVDTAASGYRVLVGQHTFFGVPVGWILSQAGASGASCRRA